MHTMKYILQFGSMVNRLNFLCLCCHAIYLHPQWQELEEECVSCTIRGGEKKLGSSAAGFVSICNSGLFIQSVKLFPPCFVKGRR